MAMAARGVDSQAWTSNSRTDWYYDWYYDWYCDWCTCDLDTGMIDVEMDCYALELVYPHTLIQTYSRAGMLVLIYPSTGCCCVTLQICL